VVRISWPRHRNRYSSRRLGSTLKALAAEPQALIGKVDWITKLWLLRKFMEQEKLDWDDAWLKAQDLEFHHIDPARSLGIALCESPPAWELSAKAIEAAVMEPPQNTPRRRAIAHHALLKEHAPPYPLIGKSSASKASTRSTC